MASFDGTSEQFAFFSTNLRKFSPAKVSYYTVYILLVNKYHKTEFIMVLIGGFMLCCAVNVCDFTLFSVLGSCSQTRDDLGCAV